MRRRGGRAFRAVSAVGCGLAVIAALGVLALHSAPVRALLLGRIVASVNEGIRGRLTAEALEVHGTTFAVRGLELRAPGGEVVATASRVAGVPLWPLVRRRLVLDGASMADVRVSATAAPRGVDLFDALARAERGAEHGGGGLELRSVSIDSGRVIFAQQLVASAAARVDGDVESGWIGRREAEGPLVIAFRGAALAPLGGAYHAEFRLHPRSAGEARDVVVVARGLRVELTMQRAEDGRTVHVHELVASPEAARALWPAWPLRETATVRGRVLARRAEITTDAEATIASGTIRVRAALDRTGAQAHRAVADFRSVDGAALGPLPSSRLSGTVELDGAAGLEGPGSITVHLDEKSTIGDRRVGPASASAVVRHGRVKAAVAAALGGVSVAVEGEARVSDEGRQVRLEALEADVAGLRWKLGRAATFRSGGGAVSVDHLALRSGRKVLSARGAASGERLRATFVADGFDGGLLSAAARAAGLRGVPDLEGTLGARLFVGGTPSLPLLELVVRSPRLRIGSLPPTRLRLTASASHAATHLFVLARTGAVRARAEATVPQSAAVIARQLRGGARGELSFTASADIDAAAAAVAERRWSVDRGAVEIRARAGGTFARPWLHARARLRGLARAGAPAFDGDASAEWHGDGLRGSARLVARSGGVLEVTGSVRRQGDGRARQTVLDAAAIARAFDPAPIARWIPRVESASGTIDGRASVTGPLDALRTSWRLTWASGRLVTSGFGTFGPFRVQGDGDGATGKLAIDGASGRGTFTVRAEAQPRGDGVDLSGELNVVRLPIVVDSELRAWATARVGLSGLLGGGELRARAEVREGDVELPEHAGGALQAVSRPEGIVVVSGAGAQGARDDAARAARRSEALRPGEGWRWQLDVVAAQPVAVHGGGVRARVVTAPTLLFQWTDRLLAFGALRATSGELSGAGIDVVSGTELRFAGPPDPPFLEVAPARDLAPVPPRVQSRRRPASDAPAPRRRLYSLLSEGRSQAPRSSAHSSVEGPGWGSAIDRALASQVPIGAFLERGTTSRTADVQSSVTGQLDLGTVSRLAGDPSQGENRRTIRLGIRLGPRLRLEGSSGDGGVSGVDVMWDLRGGR